MRNDPGSNTSPSLPTPSCVSWNTTSCSFYGSDASSIKRRDLVFKQLRNLLLYDIIFLQETKLLKFEANALKSVLKGYQIYYNNHPENDGCNPHRAGTITAIRTSILKDYTIVNHNTFPGHIQATTLTNKHNSALPSLNLINVYLDASGDIKKKEKQLKSLFKLSRLNLNYLGGDFNFTEHSNDSTNEKVALPANWAAILDHFNLREVKQDTHSYFFGSQEASIYRSSRIDRIYTSHTEADLTVRTPHAVILGQCTPSRTSYNFHLPIAMNFHSASRIKGQVLYHRHIFERSDFRDRFDVRWSSMYLPPDPTQALKVLETTLTSTHDEIVKSERRQTDTLMILQTCIKLLRAATSPVPDLQAIQDLTRAPNVKILRSLIGFDGVSWEVSLLRDFIKELLTNNGVVTHPPPSHDSLPTLSPDFHTSKREQPLAALKFVLPSSKHNITSLRTSPDEPPTSDQDQLGSIIRGHWQPVWAPVPITDHTEREGIICEYLNNYSRRIDHSLIKNLHADLFLEAIRSSSNSSPGPDGIPFAAWRVISDIAAPILFRFTQAISSGLQNIATFNKSKLFLLPKKLTGLVGDTRPICINNTANRLVARTLVLCISDAVDNFISQTQKGFISGRRMTDHLRTLNETFYSAWASDDDHFVLFTDNAKAFDSIHHDYIFATLIRQGFPPWFITTVENLMANVTVYPTLCPDYGIDIGRGVKQGCPLSPLLFVLAYDPLVSTLEYTEDLSPRAAADDLAISSSSFEALIDTFPILDTFTRVSGLGINKDKTAILPCRKLDSLEPDGTTLRSKLTLLVSASSWPSILLVDSKVYLGILFYNSKDKRELYDFATAVFQAALDKATSRLTTFRSILRTFSLEKKIQVINVFVTPIFSYLMAFLVVPYRVYKKYIEAIRRSIIPFGGRGFAYSFLIIPAELMGLRAPLQDLWVLNMFALLKNVRFDLIDADDLPYNLNSHNIKTDGVREDSPRFSDNSTLALMEFLGPNFLRWDRTVPPCVPISSIKPTLITYGFFSPRPGCIYAEEKDLLNLYAKVRLKQRFLHFGCDFQSTLEHFDKLPKSCPPMLITRHLLLFTNSASTDRRLHSAKIPNTSTHSARVTGGDPASLRPYPCYFCSKGEDCIAHIFGVCLAIKTLTEFILSFFDVPEAFGDIIRSKSTPLFVMDYPVSPGPFSRVTFILALNFAIWGARTRLKAGARTFSRIVVELMEPLSKYWTLGNTRKRKAVSSKYGNASNRTPSQQLIANQDIERLLTAIPDYFIRIFTDGSSIGNPGPAGAGALIVFPNGYLTHLSQPLGCRGNNFSELWGIGMAWTYLLDHFDPAHPPPHVICLTDSQYAFVAITKGIKARTLTKLLRAIFRLKALLSKSLAELRIHWIPAHTGCRENDIADDLANLASRAAAAEPIFVTTPTVSNPRFNYILRNDYLHTHNQLH